MANTDSCRTVPTLQQAANYSDLKRKGEWDDTIHIQCSFWQFHGHEGFVTFARTLWHPFEELKHLTDLMVRAIFDMLSSIKLEVAKRRLETLTRR
jgi:hypothetical protein